MSENAKKLQLSDKAKTAIAWLVVFAIILSIVLYAMSADKVEVSKEGYEIAKRTVENLDEFLNGSLTAEEISKKIYAPSSLSDTGYWADMLIHTNLVILESMITSYKYSYATKSDIKQIRDELNKIVKKAKIVR